MQDFHNYKPQLTTPKIFFGMYPTQIGQFKIFQQLKENSMTQT